MGKENNTTLQVYYKIFFWKKKISALGTLKKIEKKQQQKTGKNITT